MHTRTSGGSSDTEVNALTVVPQGCEPACVWTMLVTTVTPVTKRPITSR